MSKSRQDDPIQEVLERFRLEFRRDLTPEEHRLLHLARVALRPSPDDTRKERVTHLLRVKPAN